MSLIKSITNLNTEIRKENCFEVKDEHKEAETIQTVLGLSSTDTAKVFAYFFAECINAGSDYFIMADDLCLKYSNMEALCYIKSFEELLEKKYFIPRGNIPYVPGTFDLYFQFDIPVDLIDLIIHEVPLSNYSHSYTSTNYDFMELVLQIPKQQKRVFKLNHRLKNFMRPYYEHDEKVRKFFSSLGIEGDYSKITDYSEEMKQIRNFCIMVYGLGNNESSIGAVLDDFNYYTFETQEFFEDIKNKRQPLFNLGYFKLVGNESTLENASFAYGDKITSSFGDKLYLLNMDCGDVGLERIEANDIKHKELYYNPTNEKDIERLRNLLKEDNYQNLRKRLEEKGLRKALTIVLFGPPGTGKTETVMQLAKETGRTVLHLNIEQIRSCWVGESEKNIKKVFESYKQMNTGLKPILLFNEADAILSKRTSVEGVNSSVAKMENTIQNILLEELENLDGIFIATSNLVESFDKAFERRFLYKLELKNPDFNAKRKILKDKIPELSNELADEIARNYDFSGGQIDNISEKLEIDYILYGNKATRENVIEFCNKEKFNEEESRRVGFQS